MRKFSILLSLFLVTTIPGWSQIKSFPDLIGKWEGNDVKDGIGSLEILDSNYLIIHAPGQEFPKTKYKVDFSKSPIWLDIIVQNANQEFILNCLIQFKGDDEIRWQVTFEGDRISKFIKDTDQTKSITLYRVKKD